MAWWHIVLVVIISYLCGNISVARMIGRSQKTDVTKLGSGNPGSTNILRNFGFKLGLLNLVLDIIKGVLPTLAASLIFTQSLEVKILASYIAGVSAIVGHIYPVIYGFKGGKGIACMLGVFFVVNFWWTLAVVAIAAISWLCFKYGSVASFLCVTLLTVVEGLKIKGHLGAQALASPYNLIVSLLLFAIFGLTWFAHRKNIQRLLVGRESKVDLLKSTKKKMKKNDI